MNARETDHFLPRTPDVKGIEVSETTFDEYTKVREGQEAALRAKREVEEDHSGDITIHSVEDTRRLQGRMHVLRTQIQGSKGAVPDTAKPVIENNPLQERGSTAMSSEVGKKGLLQKIKGLFA